MCAVAKHKDEVVIKIIIITLPSAFGGHLPLKKGKDFQFKLNFCFNLLYLPAQKTDFNEMSNYFRNCKRKF